MARELTIDSFRIHDDGDCYVIAEIGHNHQGKVEIAKDMFQNAKECGANAVKLQKRNNRLLFTADLYNSPYVSESSYGDTYGEHREALEFGEDEYRELKSYASEIGITMFATAFDPWSADFLEKMDMPAYKIASGDLKNTLLQKYIAQIGKPIILSAGGGSLDDIKRAYDAIIPINEQLSVLQCTASYPTEVEDMHLRVISTLRQLFPDVVIGLSDHQNGIALAVVAYILGARVIEKHFTLNRAWKGTDHAYSLEPVGLRKLVRDLRRARIALGDRVKQRLPVEEKPLYRMSKKLVAVRELTAGHVIKAEDIAVKSPGDGLPPYMLKSLVGSTIINPIREDENINLENLELPAKTSNFHESPKPTSGVSGT